MDSELKQRVRFTMTDLKNMQEVELCLLEKLKNICKKYQLTYYAACGTLLGTIRHKGFIPWDDDMDLFLPWPDYKKLVEVAPKECKYPFFFQSIYTERDAMANACRLRRTDTTGFTRWEYENVGPGYNLGIFIDIFPLFNVPDSKEDREAQKEKVMHTWRCIHGHDAYIQKKRGGFVNKQYESFFPEFERLCYEKGLSVDYDITWLKEEYLEACAWNKRGKEVGTTSSRCHKPTLMWNAEWFDRTIELPFENTTITCPYEYEKILEKSYGDWRTPIEGGSDHEMIIVDTNIPYQDYDLSSISGI